MRVQSKMVRLKSGGGSENEHISKNNENKQYVMTTCIMMLSPVSCNHERRDVTQGMLCVREWCQSLLMNQECHVCMLGILNPPVEFHCVCCVY